MSFAQNLLQVGIGALVATPSTYRLTDHLLPFHTLNEDQKPSLRGILTHAAVAVGLSALLTSLQNRQDNITGGRGSRSTIGGEGSRSTTGGRGSQSTTGG